MTTENLTLIFTPDDKKRFETLSDRESLVSPSRIDTNLVLRWGIQQLLAVNPDAIPANEIADASRRIAQKVNPPEVELARKLLAIYTLEEVDYLTLCEPKTAAKSSYPLELVRDTLEAALVLSDAGQKDDLRLKRSYELGVNHARIEALVVATIGDAAKALGWKPDYHFHNGNDRFGRLAYNIPGRVRAAQTRRGLDLAA